MQLITGLSEQTVYLQNGYEAVDRQQAALRIIMNASTLKVIL